MTVQEFKEYMDVQLDGVGYQVLIEDDEDTVCFYKYGGLVTVQLIDEGYYVRINMDYAKYNIKLVQDIVFKTIDEVVAQLKTNETILKEFS